MTTQFVKLLCDVSCNWEGLQPVYRAYVNDELFAERTWIWDNDIYLEEQFQIEAEPGEYQIRYELTPPHLAQLTVSNMRVSYGSATVENNTLRIHDAPV